MNCGHCYVCLEELDAADGQFPTRTMTHFVICELCGNKRCPHSTDHELACTGSNEPGQKGSRYA